MTGFFTETEMEEMFGTKIEVKRDGPDCLHCGLYKKAQSPKMDYTGEGKLKCLIIGEGPGKDEDENWRMLGYKKPTQFIGKVGQFLRKRIKNHGLDLDRDFWKINAVNCRPVVKGKNREPNSHEIECCKPMIDAAIKKLKPEFIWLLGEKAIKSFYREHFKKNPISRWRGLCIPDRKTNAYILPMYHPSYPMRDSDNKNLLSQYNRDIKHAIKCFGKQRFSFEDEKKHISRLYAFDDVIDALDRILKHPPKYLVHDYETTGTKPYRPGHKIVSISMCAMIPQALQENFGIFKAWSFPYDYKDHFTREQKIQIKKRFRKILVHPKIRKLAHHIGFEHNWSRKMLGIITTPWHRCTLIAAHILDNRQKYCGLKFQTYINFGALPYDTKIAKYLEGFPFNRIEEIELPDLLLYGGLDSIYCMKLFLEQVKKFNVSGRMINAYNFFHEGALEMANIEYNGICVDEEYCNEESKDLKKKYNKILNELKTGIEAKKFRDKIGRALNITSNMDLGILFYEILGAPEKRTKPTPSYPKGNYVVDEKTLSRLNLPFVDKLIRAGKIEKVRGTYLSSFMRETCDGKMHPNISLTIPVSYRPSVFSPNFANIPTRDKQAKRSCRRAIKPSPGNKLLSGDYSRAEVCMAACVTKDKSLIKYVTDPSTDMHRDCAMDIWKLSEEDITDDIRFYAKSDWTFAQFYNDWYGSIAPNLWYNCLELKTTSGIKLKDHIKSIGINNLTDFKEHLKEVERIFWNERFTEYKEWKDKANVEYRKKGYIETPIGFKYQGYMTFNQVCNYPIQGPAFHWLLWMLIEVGKIKRKEK